MTSDEEKHQAYLAIRRKRYKENRDKIRERDNAQQRERHRKDPEKYNAKHRDYLQRQREERGYTVDETKNPEWRRALWLCADELAKKGEPLEYIFSAGEGRGEVLTR